jgi:hypothetical protein
MNTELHAEQPWIHAFRTVRLFAALPACYARQDRANVRGPHIAATRTTAIARMRPPIRGPNLNLRLGGILPLFFLLDWRALSANGEAQFHSKHWIKRRVNSPEAHTEL